MDKNEIITLSSDEESDFANQFKPKIQEVSSINLKSLLQSYLSKNQEKKEGREIKLKNEDLLKKINRFKQKGEITVDKKLFEKNKLTCENSPEIVDLEESIDKSPEEAIVLDFDAKENHSSHLTEDKKSSTVSQCNNKFSTDYEKNKKKNKKTTEITFTNLGQKIHEKQDCLAIDINSSRNRENSSISTATNELMVNSVYENIKKESCDIFIKIPDYFEEFVECCGSLEKIPNDKLKLMKKLRKRFTEADQSYVQSKDFKTLIEKSKAKLDRSNLYLIAKNITDELSLRKTMTSNLSLEKENNQRNKPEDDQKVVQKDCSKQSKKKTKLINKIARKLDKLGEKIRELEEKEVDLSDEEESIYVTLQRYRERFCQIYKKLCEIRNDIPDAGRMYSRKICFNGSNSPAINSCIEKWLNKTKKFPDFTDILKLLESESASLGLSSNKESLRILAIEIFQKVGQMLQRRRKYDLWDSFCGFLDNSEDPTYKNPELEMALRKNFETRVKKEEEIFNYFAEKQEKELLEPEEVPEEEANCSPPESGSDDDAEIEKIENSIHERLDNSIENVQIGNGDENLKKIDFDDDEGSSKREFKVMNEKTLILIKESKNNFKNCKSLKWRCENKPKIKQNISGNESIEENSTKNLNGTFKEKNGNQVPCEDVDKKKIEKGNLKEDKPNETGQKINVVEIISRKENQTPVIIDSRRSVKRRVDSENRILEEKRPCLTSTTFSHVVEVDVEKENSKEEKNIVEIFDVHFCHVEQNFEEAFCRFNFLDGLNEKNSDLKKGKVFKDLTNVSRLMKLGKNKSKSLGLFYNSFYHRNFHNFEKPSWKRRYTLNFKSVNPKNQKCALNQNDDSGKNVNGTARDSKEKDMSNNSDKGEGKGINNFSGHGGGNEEDNDGDANRKKNGQTLDDTDENKNEEDDEEKDEESGDEENIHFKNCSLTSIRTEHVFKNDETKENKVKSKKKKNKKKLLNEKFNISNNEELKNKKHNEILNQENEGIKEETNANTKNDKNCQSLSEEYKEANLEKKEKQELIEESKNDWNYESPSQENEEASEDTKEIEDVNEDFVDPMSCETPNQENEIASEDITMEENVNEDFIGPVNSETPSQENEVPSEKTEEIEDVNEDFISPLNSEISSQENEEPSEETEEIEDVREDFVDPMNCETQSQENEEPSEETEEIEDVNEDFVGPMNCETQSQENEIASEDITMEEKVNEDFVGPMNCETSGQEDEIVVEDTKKEEDINEDFISPLNYETPSQENEEASEDIKEEEDINEDFVAPMNCEKSSQENEITSEEIKIEEYVNEDFIGPMNNESSSEENEIEVEDTKEKEDLNKDLISPKNYETSSQENEEASEDTKEEEDINEDFIGPMNYETPSQENEEASEDIKEEEDINEDFIGPMNYETSSQENELASEETKMKVCKMETEVKQKLKEETEVKKFENDKIKNKAEAPSTINAPESTEELEKSENIHMERYICEDKEIPLEVTIQVLETNDEMVKTKLSIPEKPKTVFDVPFISMATTSKNRPKIDFEESKNVFKTPAPPKRIFSQKIKSLKSPETSLQKLSTVETIVQSIRQKKNKKSPSDEERVKRFLLNSPSSISITPPKKLCLSNPPSQAALQALATLRNLKGISATRVRGKPKSEDDVVVIGESSNRKSNSVPQTIQKHKQFDLPVIANVHSMKSSTHANRSKFPVSQCKTSTFAQTNTLFYNQVNGQSSSNSSSLRISNVWGSLPDSVYESIPNNDSATPGCSYLQNNSSPNTNRKKSTKKRVEYVVLD